MPLRVGQVVLVIAAVNCAGPAVDRAAANLPPDPTCGFIKVAAHPDPARLIEEFVARDARGEFTRASAWFNGAVDCPGHEPGPDEAAVVTAHEMRMVARGPDTAAAIVTWQRIGYASGDRQRRAIGVEIDTLRAVRTPFGWRVASPALNPHVPSPAASRPDV